MSIKDERSTEVVFKDHVRLRLEGKLEDDLERNYSEHVVLLTVNSNAQGHDAIRTSATRLEEQLPQASFEIIEMQTNGPFALLIWSARSSGMDAVEGADSFVIENGKIVFQSIHYGLKSGAGDHARGATIDGHPNGD
ncbi:nuclear transport factor 2 family protein [Pelagibacterium sp. H642]|uniref:nuclear transport factor 2 family protein n=1 Tax=Pelagibacterium sp. H642 TaxID=1881069 RepID=UPI002814ABDB|nr:nuclear transport factor 2 family protein [Pelagibacterium sp. H642]WMT92891.1 nuclear transport factor 2 family protein [Pelagibacterium sp. H642]